MASSVGESPPEATGIRVCEEEALCMPSEWGRRSACHQQVRLYGRGLYKAGGADV